MLDAEKVVMDRTGHHSLDGLKPYARTTDFQQQQVSSTMTREIQPSSSDIGSKEPVLHEIGNVGAKLEDKVEEKVKGLVSGNQMNGCTFNITFKM